MLQRIPDATGSELKGAARILILYESTSSRESALSASPQLEAQSCVGLDIEWCSFTMLSDPVLARVAARKAEEADLVVFAVGRAGDLPEQVKCWTESCLRRRSEREGALVGLVERSTGAGDIACLKEIYLRHVAHCAGMDYLSHVPAVMPMAIPDSLDSYSTRAGQVTSVLDEILHTRLQPPTLRG